MPEETVRKQLSFLGQELVTEIIDTSPIREIPGGTEILKEGQYVKQIPIVINGLVKVISRFKERELLLYYIRPNESCVMSFSASTNNEPSKVSAVTEEDSEILLLPVGRLPNWMKSYPRINDLFYQQYNQRYIELLDTISHLLVNKLDKRLYEYLKEKARYTNQRTLNFTHSQIANELGTVREVISRVLKKLEAEGKVRQVAEGIKLLEL